MSYINNEIINIPCLLQIVYYFISPEKKALIAILCEADSQAYETRSSTDTAFVTSIERYCSSYCKQTILKPSHNNVQRL